MMNKGKLFSSTRKIALTIINLAILGIACTIVCFVSLCDSEFPADKNSVDWDSMSRAWLSTRARPMPAGPVPTMPPRLSYYHGGYMTCFWCWKWLLYIFALGSKYTGVKFYTYTLHATGVAQCLKGFYHLKIQDEFSPNIVSHSSLVQINL